MTDPVNTAQQYRVNSAFFPKLAIIVFFGVISVSCASDGHWLSAGITFLLGVATWGNA